MFEVSMEWTSDAFIIAGKHATEQFEDVGHSEDARELMVDYEIGELAEVSWKISVHACRRKKTSIGNIIKYKWDIIMKL